MLIGLGSRADRRHNSLIRLISEGHPSAPIHTIERRGPRTRQYAPINMPPMAIMIDPARLPGFRVPKCTFVPLACLGGGKKGGPPRNARSLWRLAEVMTKDPIVLFPGMLKPLRLARVHGFLIERRDGLYYFGGSQPVCSMALAQRMVEGGWLVKYGQRYEPTERGLRAAE